MTREQATREARQIAESDRIEMVVTFNPYTDESVDDAEKYGFFPARAKHIFRHEEVIETIKPNTTEATP